MKTKLAIALALGVALAPAPVLAQTTAFNYTGFLLDGTTPAKAPPAWGANISRARFSAC
jgi:hypothetical protein